MLLDDTQWVHCPQGSLTGWRWLGKAGHSHCRAFPWAFSTARSPATRWGRTVALTLADRAVAKASLYQAFGTTVRNTGFSANFRLANAKERTVSLGLDNRGLRHFDPEIGSGITGAPIGHGHGLNLCVYVHNNPINQIDAEGLFAGFPMAEVGRLMQKAADYSVDRQNPALASAAQLGADLSQLSAGLDPAYAGVQTLRRDIAAVRAHGVVGAAQQRFGELVDSLSHNAVQAVDLNNEHTPLERGIYAWGAAGDVVVTLYIGGKTLKAVRTPKTPRPPPVLSEQPQPRLSGQVPVETPPEGTTAFRYVSEGEATAIRANEMRIPNIDAAGKPRDIPLTYERYETARQAEQGLRMGARDPRGPQPSPTHRVTADMRGVNLNYAGNSATKGPVEIRTRQEPRVTAIDELEP